MLFDLVASAINKGWLDGISADLESENYACGAAVLGAHSVGAPHIRQRLYWVGHAHRSGLEECRRAVTIPQEQPPVELRGNDWDSFDRLPCTDGKTRRIESGSFPLAHGFPGRVGVLRGYGNAIVPQVAQAFIESFLDL